MIRIDGLGKTFRPRVGARGAPVVEALSGLTVAIPEGAVWGVVGPNGAGKTTLFALLLGFLHPTSGTIEIEGEEPRTYVRRHGAAYLPERFRLPPEWSVRDALSALAALEGLAPAARGTRVATVLERFELGLHAAKPIGTLSHGLLQRVGLAQALLAEHRLVVLDEPTEGLDPLWRIRFRALVEELKGHGRTILIASHDLGEVERLAQRALLLDRGRLLEVMDLATPGGATSYRLELAAPAPRLGDIFPGATPAEPTAADAAPGGREAFLVTAADSAELSRRIAALLEVGGILAAVAPATGVLEERVRRALQPQAEPAARPPAQGGAQAPAGAPPGGEHGSGSAAQPSDQAEPGQAPPGTPPGGREPEP